MRFFYGDGLQQGIDEVKIPGVPEGGTVRYHGVVEVCQTVKGQQWLEERQVVVVLQHRS